MSRATNLEDLPLLLNVPELREYLGLSHAASYAVAHLIGIKIGRRLAIPRARLEKWLVGGAK